MDSPMVLSTRLMQMRGYRVYETEKNLSFRGIKFKQDLFGFCDLLCLRKNEIVAVQTTSASNASARVHKITDSDELPFVRDAGISIVVHGWRKDGTCREIDLS